MSDINKEVEQMADKMEKSVENTEFNIDILKATVLKLGPEGLKKALPTLNEQNRNLLKSFLEDLKKSHRELIAADKSVTLEPKTNSTPSGDYLFNEDEKPKFDLQDEDVAEEAKKKKQMEHKNQGGGAPMEGWEGQVIKSEESYGGGDGDRIMKNKEESMETCETNPKEMKELKKKKKALKKSIQALTAAIEVEKILQGDKVQKSEDSKLIKLKNERKAKKESLKEVKDQMEKGGSGSGRKPIAPGLEGVESVKNMRERNMATTETANKFKENVEEKKVAAKKNLGKMMKRMQDRKMEKSVCVSKLAKSMEVDESKISAIWDQMLKSETYKYDDGTVGEAPKEATQQSKVPTQMAKDEEAGVHDPEDPSNPKYKDKSAQKPASEKKPESGKATETADETIAKVPETMGHKGDMKKSFYLEDGTEEAVGLKKSRNPFAHRSHGQNAHYNVDELIHLEDESKKQRLAKSTFDYLMDDDLVKAKKMKKAEPTPESEAAAQVKENMRHNSQAAKDENQAQRQAQVDEKLTRIEERAGPKVPMIKSDQEYLNELEKAFGPGIVDKLLTSLPETFQKGYEGFKKLESKLKGKVSDPGAVAASVGRKKYGKEKFDHAAEENKKMKGVKPMKKSIVNDFIEKKLDMDDSSLELAKSVRDRQNEGAFVVKSFQDTEMDALFSNQDMWK